MLKHTFDPKAPLARACRDFSHAQFCLRDIPLADGRTEGGGGRRERGARDAEDH